jgi:LacI family transcriptional regulator
MPLRFAYLVDPEITYYRRVLRGIIHFARIHGDLEIRVERAASEKTFGVMDKAGCDGLILGTRLERHPLARKLRTPAVSVSNTYPNLRAPKIVSDDVAIGRLAAEHLLDRGYRNLAYWGHGPVYSIQRFEGFTAAARVRGVKVVQCTELVGSLGAWLRRQSRPLGLFASTDSMGVQAISACRHQGYDVPQDVAVIGVDDDDFECEQAVSPLSSLSQQTERIGFLAGASLLQLINGEKLPRATLVAPGPLIARQSTRSFATEDALVNKAIRYIEQNLHRPINVDDVTEAIGTSRRLLELRFRAAWSRTPGAELTRQRMERAQMLLSTTDLSLKRIALLSGFATPVRFSQVFRRESGQTPANYRRQFLSGRSGEREEPGTEGLDPQPDPRGR